MGADLNVAESCDEDFGYKRAVVPTIMVMMMAIVRAMGTASPFPPSLPVRRTEELRLVAEAMQSLVPCVRISNETLCANCVLVYEAEKLNLVARPSAEIKRKLRNLPGIRKHRPGVQPSNTPQFWAIGCTKLNCHYLKKSRLL